MKVKLLRDHLDDKAGDSVEATPERIEYWKRIGLIKGEPHSEDEAPKKTETKKAAPKKEKK